LQPSALGFVYMPFSSNFILWFTLWLPSGSVFPHLFFLLGWKFLNCSQQQITTTLT
jgi:hypothetical protein